MAKKRRKKAAPASVKDKPVRTPERGMYLEVVITDRNGLELPVRVESFRDITSVGHKVAAQVRAYLRTVPLSPHAGYYSLDVSPRWVETAAPRVRKGAAGELEDVDNGRD